jgi:hypothetical protein
MLQRCYNYACNVYQKENFWVALLRSHVYISDLIYYSTVFEIRYLRFKIPVQQLFKLFGIPFALFITNLTKGVCL